MRNGSGKRKFLSCSSNGERFTGSALFVVVSRERVELTLRGIFTHNIVVLCRVFGGAEPA